MSIAQALRRLILRAAGGTVLAGCGTGGAQGWSAAHAQPAAGRSWQLGERVQCPPLQRLDGSWVDWDTYRGRILLVQFWASWCPFCARQNALLDPFVREHRDRGMAMMGISIDKTAEAARAYLSKHGYGFESGMVTPAWQAVFRQRKGLPQLFVFARDGRLVQIELGEMLEEEVAELVRHLS